jgi:hypothetical protein
LVKLHFVASGFCDLTEEISRIEQENDCLDGQHQVVAVRHWGAKPKYVFTASNSDLSSSSGWEKRSS